MKSGLDQKIFSVGEAAYGWEDVVLAARRWGEWDAFERDVRQGIACVKQAGDPAGAFESEDVEAAATAFRHERGLASAEEMESWLASNGFTADAWMESIVRSVLRQRLHGELERIESRHPVTDDEIERVIRIEAICGRHLERWAWSLAAQAACAQGESMPATDASARQQRLGRLEAAYARFRQHLVTDAALRAKIHSHRMEWIRLHCLLTSFPAEAMAREAALCVRQDGLDLREVAADAKRPVEDLRFCVEDCPAGLTDAFVGARKNDLLGPFPSEGAFVLYFVLDKVMPSIDDAEVRQRAEDDLVRSSAELEIGNRVRWHRRF